MYIFIGWRGGRVISHSAFSAVVAGSNPVVMGEICNHN